MPDKPNFPFRVLKKYKFASKIFQNFQPKYFLRPTASFTTFSKVENIHRSSFLKFSDFAYKMPLNSNSGLNYTFSVFFLGFGRFLSAASPIKFISFDYYYSQNHNFFYSLFENYLNPEGELTNWRSALVKGQNLAGIAKEIKLGNYHGLMVCSRKLDITSCT